jgi:transposase
VLGALDAVEKIVHTVCNDTYITSQTVCEMLLKLRQYYGKKPITIFLDNAKYQYCELVKQCAKELMINLEFLPTYSPNLNLIERFWKFVKKECLYCKYYENFSYFKNAINAFISEAPDKYKSKLETLLTWNFQTFKNVNILPD